MLRSYVIASIGVLLALLSWAAVQRAWRRHASEADRGEDPLAGCAGCGCACREASEEHSDAAAQDRQESRSKPGGTACT